MLAAMRIADPTSEVQSTLGQSSASLHMLLQTLVHCKWTSSLVKGFEHSPGGVTTFLYMPNSYLGCFADC